MARASEVSGVYVENIQVIGFSGFCSEIQMYRLDLGTVK